jgi:hypothetical protein
VWYAWCEQSNLNRRFLVCVGLVMRASKSEPSRSDSCEDRSLLRRCLFRPIPNPVTRAVFLDATFSYRRAICEMVDDRVPAVLARGIFESLGLYGGLRRHDR